MTRLTLERHQVWLYLAAILAGLALGAARPAVGARLEGILWPVLAVLLFATFLQTPLLQWRAAARDGRFTFALLTGNFVAVPLMVWGMVEAFGLDPVARLGVLLVLLVPCTDWFVSFTQLGRGDAVRAVVATPLSLVLQILLLPVYLKVMADTRSLSGWDTTALLAALAVVLVPLLAAAATQAGAARRPRVAALVALAGWGPVPLLALVVFLVAAAHAGAVAHAWPRLAGVVPVFVAYLLLVPVLARIIAWGFKLPREQGRTVVFSLGTRNSFVVLPVALSLPAGWEVAALIVVMQSLIELAGMAVYVWAVPKWVFPPVPPRGR